MQSSEIVNGEKACRARSALSNIGAVSLILLVTSPILLAINVVIQKRIARATGADSPGARQHA
jgi:hypothetical protein